VLRSRPRLTAWLGLAAATLAASLWLLGGWLALRVDRRMDNLDRSFELVGADVGSLERRTEYVERRLAAVGERVRAIGHPLHASISWPLSGPLLEGYGPRESGWHSGVDVDAPEGAPVAAAAPGVVVSSGWEDGYGNRVVVAHGRGLETTYAHLQDITVDTGVFVTEASHVGTVGCTGTCYGAHLHFEVRINGISSDPLLWLPPRGTPSSNAAPLLGREHQARGRTRPQPRLGALARTRVVPGDA
jgi:murein DD-endopeptidase MepM/ murein hydrolase activator NlpD